MATAAPARPLDQLGAATAPIPFPNPQLHRGRRDRVLCYDPETGNHDVLDNVLVRQSNIQQAYWKIPFRDNVQTIMGHVEFCRVLRRTQREVDEDDSASSTMENDEEDDEELVFEFTDQTVAVKVNYATRMDQLRGRHAENPLQEIAAMQLLGDDPVHVLGAMDVLFDGQNLNIVMRFCRSGDLFQLLQDSQNRPDLPPGTPGLTEDEARFWFRQLMDGVQFLHARGICHRDLSPENVMIDGDQGLIIDMGMCLRVPYQDKNGEPTSIENAQGPRCLLAPLHPSGKLPYMSPEIYTSRQPFDGHAVDVWTCGTILFCNRSYGIAHRSDAQFYWMTENIRQLLGDWNVNISEEAISLLQGMLQVNARERITVEEIRDHPWFVNNV